MEYVSRDDAVDIRMPDLDGLVLTLARVTFVVGLPSIRFDGRRNAIKSGNGPRAHAAA
jgi:hypothetical protein